MEGMHAEEQQHAWGFPFAPYDIQVQFVEALQRVLQEGDIGVFESPTGTGKTLSILCGTLSWLVRTRFQRHTSAAHDGQEEQQQRQRKEEEKKSEPEDWVAAFHEESLQRVEEDCMEEERQKRERVLQRLARRTEHRHTLKRRRMADAESRMPVADDAAWLLDGDDETSSLLQEVMQSVALEEEKQRAQRAVEEAEESSNAAFGTRKVYYCSRTHSQLHQFVEEARRLSFLKERQVLLCSLASRQRLCVNPAVRKLKTASGMNDACQELREKAPGCPYMTREAVRSLTDFALAATPSMEDLAEHGKEKAACSYYASRGALPNADLVVLPYQMVLHQATREALGIELKDNVVIFDEAHNLVDTINQVYSADMTGFQLRCAHEQVTSYLERYKARLHASNYQQLKQLLFIIQQMLGALSCSAATSSAAIPDAQLLHLNDFLVALKVEHLNLFQLVHFVRERRLAQKMRGFLDHSQPSSDAAPGLLKDKNACQTLVSLLTAFTSAAQDGRVLVQRHWVAAKQRVEFLLLQPEQHFRDIVAEAHSIVLAGGTLQPLDVLSGSLFPEAKERVRLFSCSHVVEAERVALLTLTVGPTGAPLRFDFQQRSSAVMMRELLMTLRNIEKSVCRGGIVVFFPSYSYEAAYWRWRAAQPVSRSGLRVFRGSDAAVFEEYKLCIASGAQAVLHAVVGGKLSEGINFSDDLARCVVMVGVPYPNVRDPVLREKMKLLDANKLRVTGSQYRDGLAANALNQSIGRAIRHKNDYAAIVLLDSRYAAPHLQGWISQWLRRNSATCTTFGSFKKRLVTFYKKQQQGASTGETVV